MSKEKQTIGNQLMKIGASWAVSSAKHWQHGYMVHPNNNYPHEQSIKYFNTLKEIRGYIALIKELRAMPEGEASKYQILRGDDGYYLERA